MIIDISARFLVSLAAYGRGNCFPKHLGHIAGVSHPKERGGKMRSKQVATVPKTFVVILDTGDEIGGNFGC